jgi:splicing factor 3B subunit 1
MFPAGYKVLQPPTGYVPIRTPARKLIATPTPMAGTPTGFKMQTPDQKTLVVDMQPKGNLPMMKPDDMQYFDKKSDPGCYFIVSSQQ